MSNSPRPGQPLAASVSASNCTAALLTVPGEAEPVAADSGLVQSLGKIADDVLGLLNADGHPDDLRVGACLPLLLLRQLRVHHAGWMCYERPCVSEVCNERDHLDAVDDRLRGRKAALAGKGEERAGTLWAVLVCECLVLARAEARVRNAAHLGVLLQELCHLQGVGAMLVHAQGQGLHAHGDEEGIEGAEAGSAITQAQGLCTNAECYARLALRAKHVSHRTVLAKCLVDVDAVVGLAGGRQDWEFP
mmetsp:Transcript_3725/g.7493  ORF Transcript_3725/g.7493 Transcript_3725/m.7493 type:complete len:248 (-) Transcript_3725:752-1495(-)